eukprot:5161733-Prymnesium_polylepis.1
MVHHPAVRTRRRARAHCTCSGPARRRARRTIRPWLRSDRACSARAGLFAASTRRRGAGRHRSPFRVRSANFWSHERRASHRIPEPRWDVDYCTVVADGRCCRQRRYR